MMIPVNISRALRISGTRCVACSSVKGVRNPKIAVAGIKPSDVVADVGVGTGFLAEGALAAGARVIGIDSSDGMLTQARRRFAEKRFEARAAEIDSVPLSTGCVSALDSRG
jgi:2-polyprenyl-3-methyl-5-hydroxy-6-metoxy-1,4-benzoquinol methylase